ncbi:MAG: hypothetical protein AB7V42_05500 [Thermoleophilia bacterium]
MLDENDRLLLAEICDLIATATGLPVLSSDLTGQMAKARWFALGSAALAVELARGVVSETAAEPPRALNALRLARHLWECEHELHYLLDDPGRRVEEFVNRETRLRSSLRDSDTAVGARTPRPMPAAPDLPSVPNRQKIARLLGREREYHVHYRGSSWFSHPNMQPMLNSLATTAKGITVGSPEMAQQLPGMALSLTRLTLARLLLRAYREVGHTAGYVAVDRFMKDRGIAETGVLEEEDPEPEDGEPSATAAGGDRRTRPQS